MAFGCCEWSHLRPYLPQHSGGHACSQPHDIRRHAKASGHLETLCYGATCTIECRHAGDLPDLRGILDLYEVSSRRLTPPARDWQRCSTSLRVMQNLIGTRTCVSFQMFVVILVHHFNCCCLHLARPPPHELFFLTAKCETTVSGCTRPPQAPRRGQSAREDPIGQSQPTQTLKRSQVQKCGPPQNAVQWDRKSNSILRIRRRHRTNHSSPAHQAQKLATVTQTTMLAKPQQSYRTKRA